MSDNHNVMPLAETLQVIHEARGDEDIVVALDLLGLFVLLLRVRILLLSLLPFGVLSRFLLLIVGRRRRRGRRGWSSCHLG